MIFDYKIPKHLLNIIVFKREIYSSKKDGFLIFINNELKMFCIDGNEVITFCNLSSVLIRSDMKPMFSNADVLPFFNYVGRTKRVVYLLVLDNQLIAFEKKRNSIEVLKCNNSAGFEITDKNANGKSVFFTPFPVFPYQEREKFIELIEAERFDCFGPEFQGSGNRLSNEKKINAKNRIELCSSKIFLQKSFITLSNFFKFGPCKNWGHNISEKSTLINFGQSWTHIRNETLVIGIPILNCSYKRKRVADNIHGILKTNNGFMIQTHFSRVFKSSMTQQNAKCESISHSTWNANSQTLSPGMTGVVIIKVALSNFRDFSDVVCFIEYETMDNENSFSLQLFVGKLLLNTKIVDKKFCFEPDTALIDLLLIESTSVCSYVKFELAEQEQIVDVLVNTFDFTDITDLVYPDINKLEYNTITSIMPHNLLHNIRYFYQTNTGILILIYQCYGSNKIKYCLHTRTQGQLSIFLEMFKNEVNCALTCKLFSYMEIQHDVTTIKSFLVQQRSEVIYKTEVDKNGYNEDWFKTIKSRLSTEFHTDCYY